MALNKRKVLDAARKYAQKGAKAKALKEYNKLLKEDPRDAKLLLEVGDAYRRWGQNEEAIAQYGKVAQQYRQDGFDARAVAVFKQILNLDPKNYTAYVSLSELYQRMGLDSEAVGALQTAADGYHKEGRKAEALDLLRQMAALDPTNTTSRLKVAELLRQEGMESEAVAEYQAVVAELENQDDRDQLVTVLERILEVTPEDVSALSALVRQLMVAGALERAEPLAVRALDVEAGAPQFELLMDLYAQMGDEAKLADATRGLAKIHRERGDEEKARELMQRLPVEEVGSSSRLAVDVSEVEEPDLGEEELLDDGEPFLALDEEGPLEGGGLGGVGEPVEELSFEDEPLLDLGGEVESAPAEAAAEEPLPEGDPDQLLAEASVYLRYGKRDQAIASLRGILAQEPTHRAALEKLGEAYADDGQHSEAVQTWMRAAEQVRAAGDAEALSVLRDRIATLDPGMAEQVGEVDPSAASEMPMLELEDEPALEAEPPPDLDLDVEVDLDLDGAIDEVAHSETETGYDFGAGTDDFEIELDEDSITFDEPPVEAPTDAGMPGVEVTAPEFESEPEIAASAECSDGDDDDDFEFELDPDELSAAGGDAALVEPETGAAGAEPTDASGAEAAPSKAQIAEEIEEAEFYIAQEMYDEAEGILNRILAASPKHPSALLRLAEVASARASAPASADEVGSAAHDASVTQANVFESTARFDDEADANTDIEIDVDLDEDLEDETEDVEATAATSDASLELGLAEADVELDVDLDMDVDLASDEGGAAPEPESEPEAIEEPEPTPEVRAEAAPADEVTTPTPVDAAEVESGSASPDAEDSFDLREALADVLNDDEPPAEEPAATSGVLSTVEDGFESIFSDFKRGVTATLDAGDYDTRYDLGIAYREMGLYDDAIGEFRFCLDSEARRFDSLYLMGLCARDLGRFEDAVSHLEQALALPDLPEDRMAGVYFDLSTAEEGVGDVERACGSLRRVIELDPAFPGAADRLASLESGVTTSPALGEPGEAFESFDELFEDDDDDTAGDGALAEAVAPETFESFDDVVSEAEAALEEAELVDEGDTGSGADVPDAGADDTESASRRGGRKKISFV